MPAAINGMKGMINGKLHPFLRQWSGDESKRISSGIPAEALQQPLQLALRRDVEVNEGHVPFDSALPAIRHESAAHWQQTIRASFGVQPPDQGYTVTGRCDDAAHDLATALGYPNPLRVELPELVESRLEGLRQGLRFLEQADDERRFSA